MKLKSTANIAFFLICQLSIITGYSQNNVNEKIKKYEALVVSAKNDSIRAYNKYMIGVTYLSFDPDKADSANDISIAYAMEKKCDYSYLLALELKAQIHWMKSEFHESLNALLKFQNIVREKKNYHMLANSYQNIGAIYVEMGNKAEAIKYYENGVKIATEHLNSNQQLKLTLMSAYTDLAGLDTNVGNQLNYLKNVKIMLDTFKLMHPESRNTYTAFYNRKMCEYWLKRKNYKLALTYSKQAILCFELNSNKQQSSIDKILAADCFLGLNKADSCKIFLDSAFSFIKSKSIILSLQLYYRTLSNYHLYKKEFEKSLIAYKNFDSIEKLISDDDVRNKTSLMNITYQTAKKEEENSKLKTANVEQELQIQKTSAERNLFVVGGLGFLLLAIFMFYGFSVQKKNSRLLSLKNKTIESQHNVLFEQKKEITDSIEYSLRLQKSLLTEFYDSDVTEKNAFLIYQPKNIVSGDFYYTYHAKNYKLFLVGDCTGHGVPGAILSVIALEKCRDLSEQTLNPADFIKKLNEHIVTLLGRKVNAEGVNDGMEISCVVYKNKKWFYSGANRPLYVLKNNSEFIEIKGDKNPISANNPIDLDFTETEPEIVPGDKVFLLSDGFADQFGGNNDKKLTTKKLKEWLIETSTENPVQQKKQLEDKLADWKKDIQQTDDITIMGLRIS